MEQTDLLDMTYMYELAASEPRYIYDVVGIFLDTVPKGIADLEELIKNDGAIHAIYKQAHFLKSSTSVIKIKDVYQDICEITELGRHNVDDRPTMIQKVEHALANLNAAIPLLEEERRKCEAKMK
jgi:HPt (histidine-containing phosphotransfer) domain-containing protein